MEREHLSQNMARDIIWIFKAIFFHRKQNEFDKPNFWDFLLKQRDEGRIKRKERWYQDFMGFLVQRESMIDNIFRKILHENKSIYFFINFSNFNNLFLLKNIEEKKESNIFFF